MRYKNLKYYIEHQKLSSKTGFTLLEVLITLSIITMLIALFLTNYRAGSRNTELTFTAQKLVSDVRTAQNNSLGSVYFGGAAPVGGWGVHFDTSAKTAYLIFADQNNNKVYDSGEALMSSGGQTIALPASIIVDSITAGGNSRTALDITFLPPDPTTRIYWNTFSSSTSATVRLKEIVQGKTKDLNVNILGLIETP